MGRDRLAPDEFGDVFSIHKHPPIALFEGPPDDRLLDRPGVIKISSHPKCHQGRGPVEGAGV